MIYNSFQQLAYLKKTGHAPDTSEPKAKKEPWRGPWNIIYNSKVLEENLPYAVCKAKMKEYKMHKDYNNAKFKIVPCKS